jgi:hypothetical protein
LNPVVAQEENYQGGFNFKKMKKQFPVILLLLLNFNTYSQIAFENGYIIMDNNQKIECLIKNIDWQYNPSEFKYKLSEISEIQTGSLQSVKEFGIKNVSKYVRAKVSIDRSSENLAKLSKNRNPVFEEETLFLKVIIEGGATLFIYEERGLRRFFYQVADSEIKQLVYKPYLLDNRKVDYNNNFKQQLHNDLQCQDIAMDDFEKLNYDRSYLGRFFIKYNQCQNASYINYDERERKTLINLTIRPGINHSSLAIYDAVINKKYIDFETLLKLRLGFEVELIFPFNNNKWAVIIEPTYQNFKTDIVNNGQNFNVNYWSIELPVGIRHYLHFNERSKVFINTSIIWDLSTNSTVQFGSWRTLEIRGLNNYAIGLGYKHDDKFSLELRHFTNRNLLGKYMGWRSEYKTISLILGYSFY